MPDSELTFDENGQATSIEQDETGACESHHVKKSKELDNNNPNKNDPAHSSEIETRKILYFYYKNT